MTTTDNVFAFVFLGVCVLIVGLFLYERFTGTKMYGYIDKGKPVVAAIALLAKAVFAATSGEQFDTVSKVADAAVEGANYAEKLWLDGQIPKADRPVYARDFILEALSHAGIEVTEKITVVIESCVNLACALMPHGRTPKEPVKEEEGE